MGVDHYLAAGLLSATLFFGLHWFPWGDLPGRKGAHLPRLVTYTLGLGTVLIITTAMGVRYASTAGDVLVLLWVVSLSAGVVTSLSWLVRRVLRAEAQVRQAAVREREARTLERE